MTALTWLAGDKIKQQPTINRHEHAVNPIVRGYSMRLIRENGTWKWDLFENETAVEANSFLDAVDWQAGVFERFRAKIDRGGFPDAEEVLQAVQKELSSGAL